MISLFVSKGKYNKTLFVIGVENIWLLLVFEEKIKVQKPKSLINSKKCNLQMKEPAD